MANDPVFILSIDGGGVRGIIPCKLLMELEKRLHDKGCRQPLHNYFRLIAGTSTGGIIAAGLTAPHPNNPTVPALDAHGLYNLYKDEGAKMFSRSIYRRIREAVLDPKSIVQEKYDATELEGELQRHLGTARISDALTSVMLTAYDIEKRNTVFMGNIPQKDGSTPDDYYLWQAARATSAAPTYFEPARVRNLTRNRVETLIDGGVFANDPGICAFVEAHKLGATEKQITLVSLGTGYQTRSFDYQDARNWGPINWINPSKGAPILSILMHGQTCSAAYHLDSLLNEQGKPKRYFRFDTKLTIGNDDMDDASQTNIFALEQLANVIIEKYAEDFDLLTDYIAAH